MNEIELIPEEFDAIEEYDDKKKRNRPNHNEAERRRRQTQKQKMDELKDQIPNLSNEKTSSFVAVATSARDYIVHLKSKIYHLEREMERLGHVNSEYKRAAVAAGVSLNIYGVTGETEYKSPIQDNNFQNSSFESSQGGSLQMNYDDDMRHRAPENNYRPQMEPNTTRFISSGHSRSSSQQSISQTSNSDSPYMRSHNRNSSLGQMNMMSESSNTPKVAPYSNVPFIGSTSPSHFQTVSSSSHAPHGSSQFNMIGGNSHIGVVPSLPSGPTHSRSSSLQSIHAGEILQLSSGSSSDTITPTSQKSFQSPPNISGRSNISQLSHARAESLSKKIFHGHNRSLSGGNHHDFGVLMTLNRGPPRSASRNANHSHKTSTSLDIPLGDLNLFETDKNTISNDISFIIASNSSRFDISPQSGNPSSALAYEFPINLDPITTMENEFLGNMDSIEEQSELEKVLLGGRISTRASMYNQSYSNQNFILSESSSSGSSTIGDSVNFQSQKKRSHDESDILEDRMGRTSSANPEVLRGGKFSIQIPELI